MQENATPDFRPDFHHVESWIFDLDNTLYRADCGLFAAIDARMASFIVTHLDVAPEDAKRLQKTYYRDYGTTLSGLVARHGVDPEAFLSYVHDIDLSVLVPDAALGAAMARLPGRRFVFTNGCRHHAGRVLARLGLSQMIDAIWDIRTLGFIPKPHEAAYRLALAAGGVQPRKAAMFEDIARNLVVPHGLGMTTVWLNADSAWSRQGPLFPIVERAHIHYEIGDLSHFLNRIRI